MDGKTNHRRTTKVEQVKRLNECVEKIINDNINYNMFVDWYTDHYDMSKHNAYKDWVKCWNIIKSRFALQTDQLINKQIYQLYDLFKEAREVGDFGTSRKILEDVRKIQGIEQPDKINIKHEGTINITFGDETE
jgi:hypothetical protein